MQNKQERREAMRRTKGSPDPVDTSPPTSGSEGARKRKRTEKEAEENYGQEAPKSPIKRRRRLEGSFIHNNCSNHLYFIEEKPSFEAGRGKLDDEIISLWRNRFDSSQSSLSQTAGGSEPNHENPLAQKVRSVPQKELLTYINKCANVGGDTTPNFMRAIFQGWPTITIIKNSHQLQVYLRVLTQWNRVKNCV